MALKDVKKYFNEVENQYFEMLENVKDFEEALKSGFLEQEQVDQAEQMLNRLKENYNRLCYIMVLFNRPCKKKKAKKFDQQNSAIYKYLDEVDASKENVITENTDVLKNFKEFIKGLK